MEARKEKSEFLANEETREKEGRKFDTRKEQNDSTNEERNKQRKKKHAFC
jgi:hypothetical protein